MVWYGMVWYGMAEFSELSKDCYLTFYSEGHEEIKLWLTNRTPLLPVGFTV
jgi:hypothetical protein